MRGGTPGAGSGPKKRTGRKTRTALRADFHTHTSKAMRALIDARDWLTVIRLPAYAPDLNPAEGVWSHLKRGIANLTAHGVDHLARTVKTGLRQIQNQPDLAAGFLAQTGMTLEPELPRT